jgi:CRP-like cAMP-binding protein
MFEIRGQNRSILLSCYIFRNGKLWCLFQHLSAVPLLETFLAKFDSNSRCTGAVVVGKISLFEKSVEQSRSDGDGNQIHNKILLSLPNKGCDSVLSRLVFVQLRLCDVLQEAGQPIKYCYFPNTAMVSILNVMKDGKSVEVGLAGMEGFVGLPVLAGYQTSASRAVVQAEGSAFRINANVIWKALHDCEQLLVSLLRYSQEATMEVTQIAACNRLHSVEERLARWLLMTQDRVGSDELPLTQEFLSQMLGTRRSSVSVAAATLQKAELIRYNRGHVSILNRAKLQNLSCECYSAIRGQLERWRQESQ